MKKIGISVVVPAFNEEGTIADLIKRVHAQLSDRYLYEILIINDNSTDTTASVVTSFSPTYCVRLLTKPQNIPQGKAECLLYGFSQAQYELICMIDGDLQYPPEALPEMISKIEQGADVVVANRVDVQTSFMRVVTSKFFRFFFARVLHGLTCDVQSGLKVFKKEIIERISIKPTRWTFDLEFLTHARSAGYIIDTVTITFEERLAGVTKINVLKASYEIGINALKLRLLGSPIVPFHPTVEQKEGKGFHHKGIKYIFHSALHHTESALVILTTRQKLFLYGLVAVFVIGLILNFKITLIVLIGALTVLYFADLLFNFYLICKSFYKPSEIVVSEQDINKVDPSSWPTYTIFCPLYKEWEVLPQFVSAMSELDYPKDKLQVMLLLEENDPETIEKAREFNLPSYFDIVIVPHSKPKTKPKACNYGLLHAKGEYIVIYDAEDVPDTLQVKKAVLAFRRVDSTVKCIQAKLNYYNPNQNLLTRFFTAEYSLWFDLVLSGLQSVETLIPLGGTSNHFRTIDLKEMNGWDAFNVTEDCDLGIRMVKRGYRTALLDSTTLEEANSDYMNWLWQRSRWIKGYIVSYFVHMRNPRAFIASGQWKHLLALQLVVGGKILSLFINPLMWVITISYFVFRSTLGPAIQALYPAPIFYMAVLCLVAGNFMYVYYYMIGCVKKQHYGLVKYIYLIPFYWLSMSMAAWLAIYKLIVAPHQWSKTKHGLHLSNQKTVAQVAHTIGRPAIVMEKAN